MDLIGRIVRWVNELMGYMAAWMLMIPLTVHRHVHLAHHRHTNDADADPDYQVAALKGSPFSALYSALRLFIAQFSYYLEHRWYKAPAKQNLYLCLEVGAAYLPRLALIAAGFWAEGLLLFGLAWLLGVAITLYLFAYLVHRPHNMVGRYVDTSTILLPGPGQTLLNWLWVFQNYHSIHHLFPRVPFYKYQRLFRDIEHVMEAKGAPVYRLGMSGLEARKAAAV